MPFQFYSLKNDSFFFFAHFFSSPIHINVICIWSYRHVLVCVSMFRHRLADAIRWWWWCIYEMALAMSQFFFIAFNWHCYCCWCCHGNLLGTIGLWILIVVRTWKWERYILYFLVFHSFLHHKIIYHLVGIARIMFTIHNFISLSSKFSILFFFSLLSILSLFTATQWKRKEYRVMFQPKNISFCVI